MLDYLSSTGPEIIVSSSGSSYSPSTTTGTVRWNMVYNRLETAGTSNDWYEVSGGGATISLAPYVQETLKWAQAKMFEDIQHKALVDQYPELQHAKEQYDTVFNLIKKSDDHRKYLEAELASEKTKNRIKEDQIARLKKENVDLNAKLDTWTVIST